MAEYTVNETISVIKARRSVRSFKSDPVTAEVLRVILDAGQAAPYAVPDSRFFSVIQDRKAIAELSGAAKTEGMKLSDFHREMFSASGFDGVYGAPAVIVISGNETTVQYEAVCAASVQNILIAAASLDIASCWAYFSIFAFHGPQAAYFRDKLQIPDGYRPCASVLLGYAKEPLTDGPDTRYKNAIEYIGE
jgi:nitroreductase